METLEFFCIINVLSQRFPQVFQGKLALWRVSFPLLSASREKKGSFRNVFFSAREGSHIPGVFRNLVFFKVRTARILLYYKCFVSAFPASFPGKTRALAGELSFAFRQSREERLLSECFLQRSRRLAHSGSFRFFYGDLKTRHSGYKVFCGFTFFLTSMNDFKGCFYERIDCR